MKKHLLTIAGLLFALAVNCAEPVNVHASFADDPKTEMYIGWRTKEKTASSVVEYGLTPEYGKQATGSAEVIAGGHNHHAKLSGLLPGKTYHYRCGGPGDWSGDATFTTAPRKRGPFTFAVVGDVQGRTRSRKWQAASMWIASKQPRFWIPVGDLVQRGLRQEEWDSFFEDAKQLMHSSVIMPVIGNHDCYKDKYPGLKPTLYLSQFKVPDNGNAEFKGCWYSFNYGDANFSILHNYPNTGDRRKDDQIVKESQTEWLNARLGQTKRKWKFSFFHAPVYSSGGHGGDTLWLKDYWGKAFDKHSVDIVFTGHTHACEITVPIRAGSKAERGTIYYNTAGVNYAGQAKGSWFTNFRKKAPLVALVTVSAESAVVETWNWESDRLINTVKLKK